MSDIARTDSSHALYGGVIVDVAEDSLDKATRLLAGIKGGVYQAVGSALTRAAASGKTAAKGAVTQEYAISQSEFLARTRNINHFVRESDGGISVVFGFRGHVIPLLKFNTRVNGSGQVVTQVKRSSSAETLNRAFSASMGGHRGIYERVGASRFPVKELYGPATPQMMLANAEVTDTMEEKMAETYEKRIDHEILRILNGWGK